MHFRNKFVSLSECFPDLLLGFSDHTIGELASSLACSFGSVFFEKHFTLDNNLPGPDHWFSANPTQLKIWKNSITTSFQMLGSKKIQPTEKELINKNEFQRVIVAKESISFGDIFTDQNLEMKRVSNGNGLTGKIFKKIIGTKSNKNYLKGSKITL